MKKLLQLLEFYEHLVCDIPGDNLRFEIYSDESGGVFCGKEELLEFADFKEARRKLKAAIFNKMIQLWGTKELKDRLPKDFLHSI